VILACAGQRRFSSPHGTLRLVLWGRSNSAPGSVDAGVCRGAAEASVQRLPLRAPGNVRKITLSDLPDPTPRVRPRIRRDSCAPTGPAAASARRLSRESLRRGFERPRVIRAAPNAICSWRERGGSDSRLPRITADGGRNPRRYSSRTSTGPMASLLPARAHPQWLYIGDTDAVVRVPYQVGDLEAKGPAEHVVDLPGGRGHWTRDIAFSLDSQTMFVAVGSGSNVERS